jgi:nitronate monooxygenase
VLKTRITEMFGIEYPVMSAPMGLHSGGHLAAAVSQAGGLGLFGGTNPVGPDWLREQIHYIRSQTDRPFGVGFITHLMPVFPQLFEVALAEKVPVVAFSFADPQPWLGQAKENSMATICQVQTLAGAAQAVAAGADVLVVQGNEAGGHTGSMGLLPLLTGVIEQFPDIPVMAAGGIASGSALAAVLAAGAEGAWMGTAFMATPEAVEVPETYKERIVNSTGEDTVYTQVFDILDPAIFHIPAWPEGIAARVYNNHFVQEWHGRESELRQRLEQVVPSYLEAAQRRDPEIAAVYFGQSAASVKAVRPAAEVLRDICEQGEHILKQRLSLLTQ